MIHILIVEDDPVLGRGIQVTLELENYQVNWVRDLRSALKQCQQSKYQLFILDLGLPDGSGLDVLRELQNINSQSPVIVLTAKTDEDTVVESLQLGASDYIRKPFGNKELLARIKKATKEPLKKHQQLRFGKLIVYPEQRQIIHDNVNINLNRREFDILQILVENPSSVVSRDVLLRSLELEGEVFDRTIDSHISHLRSSLKKSGVVSIKISSVYGVGYRLESA